VVAFDAAGLPGAFVLIGGTGAVLVDVPAVVALLAVLVAAVDGGFVVPGRGLVVPAVVGTDVVLALWVGVVCSDCLSPPPPDEQAATRTRGTIRARGVRTPSSCPVTSGRGMSETRQRVRGASTRVPLCSS